MQKSRGLFAGHCLSPSRQYAASGLCSQSSPLIKGLSFLSSSRRYATPARPETLVAPELFLTGLVDRALHRAYPSLPREERATVVLANAARSDAAYQCSAPLALGKKLNENPVKIAEKVIEFIHQKEGDGVDSAFERHAREAIDRAVVARGGFIFIHLKNAWVAERVRDSRHLINKKVDRFAFDYHQQLLSQPADELAVRRKKVLIDFASPNMAKELHVGHLRAIVQGDALCNILEYVGHSVDRISHVGDFGTPMGMVVAQMLDDPTLRDSTDIPTPPELSKIYVEAKKRFDSSPDFAKRALEAAAELQKGKGGNKLIYDTYQRVCEGSRRGFDEIYKKLDVQVEERGESFYAPLLAGTINELLEKKIASISDGAVCVYLEGFSAPLIIRKGDGAYLYATTDLAAVKQRVQDLKKDWIIYVTDDSQKDHFRKVFEVAKQAGWYDPTVTRVEHVGFGLVQGEDGQKLRSRDGTPLKLIELLNEAVRQSHAVIKTSRTLMQAEEREQKALPSVGQSQGQSPRDTNQEEDSLAERIGYGAIKYFELSHNRASNYIFSFSSMLSFKGNTAVYLLYAFTRIRSIRRQLSIDEGETESEMERESRDVVPILDDKEEKELGLLIAQFPDIVLAMEERLFPNLLCDYLYKLSGKFHAFYERCRVLGSAEKTPSRLQLCFATEGVMERGLRLLGITPVEKM